MAAARDPRLEQVAWGMLLLAVGIAGTAGDLYLIYFGRTVVPRWKETEGKILESRVRTTRQSRESPTDWVDIDYEYHVNGERFVGHCCNETGSFLGSYRHVEDFVRENHRGKRIAIYVNPALPTESRLKASIGRFSGGDIGVLVITLAFVAAGVYVLLPPRLRDRIRRRKPSES